MGGLAMAAAIHQLGIPVRIYEQASRFNRVGAGIQQSPNAMKVVRRLGLEPMLRAYGFQPRSMINRDGATANVTNEVPLGRGAEEKYGAPYMLFHRGDLHGALLSAVPADSIALGKKLVGLDQQGDGITLSFADGSKEWASAVIGADGVHSAVREILFGAEAPRFSGRVGYRATFPASVLAESLDENTKWWGADRHIIIYYITAARDEVYVMGTVPEADFDRESWSAEGNINVFRQAFSDFHPTVRAVLGHISTVHKWALLDRNPLPSWNSGNVVLLGDAAHPMMPHMGQGAAMAMEDVAILTRCLTEAGPGNWSVAFRRFEASRKERTSEMQLISAGNTFVRKGPAGVDWVYGFDAWEATLAPLPVLDAPSA